jgi:hypothetical protein
MYVQLTSSMSARDVPARHCWKNHAGGRNVVFSQPSTRDQRLYCQVCDASEFGSSTPCLVTILSSCVGCGGPLIRRGFLRAALARVFIYSARFLPEMFFICGYAISVCNE